MLFAWSCFMTLLIGYFFDLLYQTFHLFYSLATNSAYLPPMLKPYLKLNLLLIYAYK